LLTITGNLEFTGVCGTSTSANKQSSEPGFRLGKVAEVFVMFQYGVTWTQIGPVLVASMTVEGS